MNRTVVMGMGRFVPERVVTNQDLTQWMDTSDDWIFERTGIRQRHWVERETGASDLAEQAARQAIAKAGLAPADIEAIIFATLSPDYNFPGSGCLLQNLLGLPGIPALDVRNQCSGFIYGLSIADAWIRTGQYRRVLLVGAEVHSTGLDVTTRGRDIACLFGDGAGAMVLGAAEPADPRGVLSTHLHADGSHATDLWLEVPASRFYPERLTAAMLEEGRHFPKMKGRQVFTHAVRRMPEVINEALSKNGVSLEEIRLVVPHQANQRINEVVARDLAVPAEKMFSNIERYGNTTAASIPLALSEAEEQGLIGRGDLVLLVSFGAGFTWASALLRW